MFVIWRFMIELMSRSEIAHTQELMKMVIGGIKSLEESGRKVMLDEIKVDLCKT